jgi:hypothetical protein
MNTDRYTRGVLTVIAGALLYICAMLSGVPAIAQANSLVSHLATTRPQPVIVVGWGSINGNGEIQISSVRDARGMIRSDANLPVKVMGTEAPLAVTLGVSPQHPLPVGLTAIAPGEPWGLVHTKVEPAPVQSRPGPGR